MVREIVMVLEVGIRYPDRIMLALLLRWPDLVITSIPDSSLHIILITTSFPHSEVVQYALVVCYTKIKDSFDCL